MKHALSLAFVVAVVVASGCGSRDPAKPASAKSKGTIGVSLLTLDNPFFKVIGDNIAVEGKKHGYETIVVSGDKDVAKQSNQIKDFIVKRVSRHRPESVRFQGDHPRDPGGERGRHSGVHRRHSRATNRA